MDPVCNTLNVCKFCRNRAFIVLRASHFLYNPEQDVHIVVLIILAWVWDFSRSESVPALVWVGRVISMMDYTGSSTQKGYKENVI